MVVSWRDTLKVTFTGLFHVLAQTQQPVAQKPNNVAQKCANQTQWDARLRVTFIHYIVLKCEESSA